MTRWHKRDRTMYSNSAGSKLKLINTFRRSKWNMRRRNNSDTEHEYKMGDREIRMRSDDEITRKNQDREFLSFFKEINYWNWLLLKKWTIYYVNYWKFSNFGRLFTHGSWQCGARNGTCDRTNDRTEPKFCLVRMLLRGFAFRNSNKAYGVCYGATKHDDDDNDQSTRSQFTFPSFPPQMYFKWNVAGGTNENNDKRNDCSQLPRLASCSFKQEKLNERKKILISGFKRN